MDKEKLINNIMKECEKDGEPVTYEEAAEMAEMELKAKQNFKHYEKSEKKRKSTAKPRKIDEEKLAIIEKLYKVMLDIEVGENVTIKNNQREITFNTAEADYSLILTKHRPNKIKDI